MKIKALSIIIALFLTLLFCCSKYKEPAPFFDGLILEYESMPGSYQIIYDVEELDDNKFKIIEKRKRKVLRDKIKEMLVDMYGKVYKSSFKAYKGKFSPIWIPVHDIEIGDTFNDTMLADRREKWEQWEVLVVKGTLLGAERYYEINTGYLVGAFARTNMGISTKTLVKTNADIPTVGE